MSRLGALAVLPLAALPSPAASQDAGHPATGPLTLECEGFAARHDAGRSTRKAGKTGRTHTDAAADTDAGSEAKSHDHAGGTTVRFVFEFDGDHGRVRYPTALTPVVHSGGDAAGWWPIRDLDAGDDAFTGRIALNLLNKARFAIDRHTGAFDLSGLDTSVSGRCAKPNATPRLF